MKMVSLHRNAEQKEPKCPGFFSGEDINWFSVFTGRNCDTTEKSGWELVWGTSGQSPGHFPGGLCRGA